MLAKVSHRLTLVDPHASVKGEFKTNPIYSSLDNVLENIGIKKFIDIFQIIRETLLLTVQKSLVSSYLVLWDSQDAILPLLLDAVA